MTDAPTLLRRGLVTLTAIGIAGTAFELATEHHWQNWEQLLPWGALALLSIAVALQIFGGSPRLIPPVRLIVLAVLLIALFGIYAHVAANYEAGWLDQRYADTWDTIPILSRWWYALTKSVGASPPLAPGMLAQTAFLSLLATFIPRRHETAERPTVIT